MLQGVWGMSHTVGAEIDYNSVGGYVSATLALALAAGKCVAAFACACACVLCLATETAMISSSSACTFQLQQYVNNTA